MKKHEGSFDGKRVSGWSRTIGPAWLRAGVIGQEHPEYRAYGLMANVGPVSAQVYIYLAPRPRR